MAKSKIALNPKYPERVCWGCEKLCSANDLSCGNGTIRTQHRVELFGEHWLESELDLTPMTSLNEVMTDSRFVSLCPFLRFGRLDCLAQSLQQLFGSRVG